MLKQGLCYKVRTNPGPQILLKQSFGENPLYSSLFQEVKMHLATCSQCKSCFYKAVLLSMANFVGEERASVWALRFIGLSYKKIQRFFPHIPEGTLKSHLYHVRRGWLRKVFFTFGITVDKSHFFEEL